MRLNELSQFFSILKSKFSNPKKTLFDAETIEWLLNEPTKGCGKNLVQEANRILADKKDFPRERLVKFLTVYHKNWLIAQGELTAEEKEIKKLQIQVNKILNQR